MPTDYNKYGVLPSEGMIVGPNNSYALVFDDQNQFKIVQGPYASKPQEVLVANGDGWVFTVGPLTYVRRRVTAAEFATLNSAPITVVPAPGEGKVLIPNLAGDGNDDMVPSSWFYHVPGTTPFDNTNDITVVWSSEVALDDYFGLWSFSNPMDAPVLQGMDGGSISLSFDYEVDLLPIENQPLSLYMRSGNPTGMGDGRTLVQFSYYTIDLTDL